MPKPNYKYAKRQKEIAKQKKKAEKLKRKQEKKPDTVQEVEKMEGVEEKSTQPDPVAKEVTNQE
jgi:hypothetical protein